MKKRAAKRPAVPMTNREYEIWNAGISQGFEQGKQAGAEELAATLRSLLRVSHRDHDHPQDDLTRDG